jgi:hypothetical protein
MSENEVFPSSGPDHSVFPSVKARNAAGAARGRSRSVKWTVLLVVLPSLVQAAFFLKLLLEYIVVRNQAFQPEEADIFAFLTSLRLHRLYITPLDFPWNPQVYGPLYYQFGAFAAKICHGAVSPTTVLMRLVSFASLLGSLAIVAYLGWRLERGKLWAAAAVIFALDCRWLIPFASSARVDQLAAQLALAALLFYETAEERAWLVLAAGVFGAAAALTKQTMVAVPLALTVHSLWEGKPRRAAIFLAGGAAAAIAILLPPWLWHEPFLANLTVVSRSVLDWYSIPGVLKSSLHMNGISLIGIFIALLGAAFSWRERKYRSILLVTLFAWGTNAAALANVGGGSQYLILPWFATMLLVPAGLRQLERAAMHTLLAPVAIFLFAALMVFLQKSILRDQPPRALSPGPVVHLEMLTDNSYLEVRSRDPQLLDPYLYNEFSKQGAWSDAPIRQRVDAEAYDLLLIGGSDGASSTEFFVGSYRGTSDWGSDLLTEMSLHYRPLCETTDYLALVPMDRTAPLNSANIAEIFNEPCRATRRIPQTAPGNS